MKFHRSEFKIPLSFAGILFLLWCQRFINEDAFSSLVNLFETNLSKSNQTDVSFGLSRADKVSLIIYPTIVDPANKIIGGADLKFDSPEHL